MNMLPIWNRCATQLGDRRCELLIQETLEKQYPQDQFPFHIEVVGGQKTHATVWIRDGRGLNISGDAYPEDFSIDREPKFTAVASKVMELANDRRVRELSPRSST